MFTPNAAFAAMQADPMVDVAAAARAVAEEYKHAPVRASASRNCHSLRQGLCRQPLDVENGLDACVFVPDLQALARHTLTFRGMSVLAPMHATHPQTASPSQPNPCNAISRLRYLGKNGAPGTVAKSDPGSA